MVINTLLFASYADALGRESVPITLPAGATVADALAHLRALPGGDRLPPAPLVAINLEYSHTDATLSAGDELAVIPPVAGG
ncbi:MAG TPA: MoaD/ThiS family protein [Gemmatimonadaceae bacterium]